MSTASRYQGGYKKETTYGDAVTPDTFFLTVSDTIKPQIATLDSKALRPGFAPHEDTFTRYTLGAQGTLKFEVSSRQFQRWFHQMVGTHSTTGAGGSYFLHTFTMAEFNDLSFTWQGNRPKFPTDADAPFTFMGGKVAKWKLTQQVTSLLELELDCDFQNYDTSTSLATASYPASDLLFAFQGCAVLFDDVTTNVSEITIDMDNKMKLDRRYLDGTGLKSEPVGDGDFRMGTFETMMDFDDMTQLDRVKAATAVDGATAKIVAQWAVPGHSDALKITIPSARFDEGWPEVSGPASLSTPLKGGVMYDGTNSPVTIEYTTLDST